MWVYLNLSIVVVFNKRISRFVLFVSIFGKINIKNNMMLEIYFKRHFAAILVSLMVGLAGCSTAINDTSSQVVSSIGQNNTNSFNNNETVKQQSMAYQLGAGDKLQLTVDGVKDHSGEFEIAGDGSVSLPFVGKVTAAGLTLDQFSEQVSIKLKDYIRNPQVRVSVLNYRPFYIQGEIKNGGQYDYSDGLDIKRAVAIAGGYTYRAIKGYVYIQRANANKEIKYSLNKRVYVRPGDNIRIPERFF